MVKYGVVLVITCPAWISASSTSTNPSICTGCTNDEHATTKREMTEIIKLRAENGKERVQRDAETDRQGEKERERERKRTGEACPTRRDRA